MSETLLSPPLIFCKSFSFKASNCSNLTVFFIIKSPIMFFSCKLTYKNYYTKWNFVLGKILSTVIFFSPSVLFLKKLEQKFNIKYKKANKTSFLLIKILFCSFFYLIYQFKEFMIKNLRNQEFLVPASLPPY